MTGGGRGAIYSAAHGDAVTVSICVDGALSRTPHSLWLCSAAVCLQGCCGRCIFLAEADAGPDGLFFFVVFLVFFFLNVMVIIIVVIISRSAAIGS